MPYVIRAALLMREFVVPDLGGRVGSSEFTQNASDSNSAFGVFSGFLASVARRMR